MKLPQKTQTFLDTAFILQGAISNRNTFTRARFNQPWYLNFQMDYEHEEVQVWRNGQLIMKMAAKNVHTVTMSVLTQTLKSFQYVDLNVDNGQLHNKFLEYLIKVDGLLSDKYKAYQNELEIQTQPGYNQVGITKQRNFTIQERGAARQANRNTSQVTYSRSMTKNDTYMF